MTSPTRWPARMAAAAVMTAAVLTAAASAAPGQHGAPAVHVEAGVHVAQAWIRWLPANLPAGGYLILLNETGHAATLVAVRSDAYANVALHRTLTSAGTARMVPVAAITVPAHGMLDFASLGYHLMLMQPRRPVQPGVQVPLTLQFADGGTLQVNADVKPPAAQPGKPAVRGMQGMPNMPNMPNMSNMSH